MLGNGSTSAMGSESISHVFPAPSSFAYFPINSPLPGPISRTVLCKFITRKLWGIANQHSFGHHGLYTTMREAVLAHAGEASASAAAFRASSKYDQDCIIEFL